MFFLKKNKDSFYLSKPKNSTVSLFDFEDINSNQEAAEYLEVAEIGLRRWVKALKIQYKRMERNIVFYPDELKAFKRRYHTHEIVFRIKAA